MIDVSLLANENGSSLAMVEGVRSCIEYISDFQPNCEVAIIVYDNKLRFFNLRPDLDNAQEYIVSELTMFSYHFIMDYLLNPETR